MGGKVGSGGAMGSGGSTGAARGAVSLHIVATPGCLLTDQYQDFPIVPGGRLVTAAGAVKMLEDGTVENGQEVHVQCSIRGPAPYQVLATISTGQSIQKRFIDFGALMAVGMPSLDTLVVATPDLPESYGSGLPELCTYTATFVDPIAGKASGSFVCGRFEGFRAKDTCQVGESYFALENCSQ